MAFNITIVRVELEGPQFVQSAVEISKKVAVQSIHQMRITNLTSDSISALQTALGNLRNYFRKNALVFASTSQALPAQTASTLSAAAGVSVHISNPTLQSQMQMQDAQQAQTIHTQIGADARKSQMQRWQINQDTQTKVFQMLQNAHVNKAKTAEKAYSQIRAFIRS